MPTPSDDQDPVYRCTNCPRLLFHDELSRYVCRVCEDRAQTQLAALPGLYGQLGDNLAPGAGRHDSGKITVSRGVPMPLNAHVLDMRGPGGIAAALLAIEDSWRSILGWGHPLRTNGVHVFAPWRTNPERDIPRHVKFIGNNLPWACSSYEDVADDLDAIRKLHAQAQNAITGERRRRITVTCLSEYDDGSQCGADLNIDVAAASTVCGSCGARWGRDDWVRLHEATMAASNAA